MADANQPKPAAPVARANPAASIPQGSSTKQIVHSQEVDYLGKFELKLADELNQSGIQKALDPNMALGVLQSVLELMKECQKGRTTEQLKAAVRSPSRVQQIALRRNLVARVGRKQLRQWNGDGSDGTLVEHTLNIGRNATDEDIEGLAKQVKRV